MHRMFILIFSLILFSCNDEIKKSETDQATSSTEESLSEAESGFLPRKEWKELTVESDYHLDIRYATRNNFVNEVLYDCGRCYLRKPAAEALESVSRSLNQIGYKIVLFDCYRPKPIQQKLWEKVPDPNYVTPPNKGSMHNRGLAVDLSIMDENGKYLDMGTEYDYFGKEAHTDFYNHSKEVLKNRTLLNDLMVKYGFKGIRTEWWHFSFVDASYPIADWVWDCPE